MHPETSSFTTATTVHVRQDDSVTVHFVWMDLWIPSMQPMPPPQAPRPQDCIVQET